MFRIGTSIALFAIVLARSSAQQGWTWQASLSSAQGDLGIEFDYSSLSADGRFQVFQSRSSNLVPGDTNGVSDIFVRDKETRTTIRASLSSLGAQSNQDCYQPMINADGRFVAFVSRASNLVVGDNNLASDVFVHDMITGETTRASISSVGLAGGGHCYSPSLSADGRFVAFASDGANFVMGDTNGVSDVFVRDRLTNQTTIASISTAGLPGNGASEYPSISGDGRYVAFSSYGATLVPNDSNAVSDVFVRDLQLQTTKRASVSTTGIEGTAGSFWPAITFDGRFVAFQSDAPNIVTGDANSQTDIFLSDRALGVTSLVSVSTLGVQGNGASLAPSVNDDGSLISFTSSAGNLVFDDSNSHQDIFVHDTQSQTTNRVSKPNGSGQSNGDSYYSAISRNGRYVSYSSSATNLVTGDLNIARDAFMYDRQDDLTQIISLSSAPANQMSSHPSVSLDGRFTAFESDATNLVNGDTNSCKDIFLRDRVTDTIERISVTPNYAGNSNGASYAPSVSADGRYIAFTSDATNLASSDTNGLSDVFVRDRQIQATSCISRRSASQPGNKASSSPVMSADGRFTAFSSAATNLVTGDTNGVEDVFVYDRISNTIFRVSLSMAGQQGNRASISPSISADGRYIAFESASTNFATNDTNGASDIFLRDRQTSTTSVISISSAGVLGNSVSSTPTISFDGKTVVFASYSNNLVPSDTNFLQDIFARNLGSGVTQRVSLSSEETQSNGNSSSPSTSKDGRVIAFTSAASNLVSGDSNGCADIFVRNLDTGQTQRVSTNSNGGEANDQSYYPSLSSDAQFVGFTSVATNLSANEQNSFDDVFIHQLGVGSVRTISGTISLQDYSANPSGTIVSWELFARPGGPIIESGTTTLDRAGKYITSLSTASGNGLVFAVKAPHWLKGSATNISLGSNQTGINFSLVNGDCNGDNVVDLSDYTILMEVFGSLSSGPQWNANADLNGEGFVNLTDYTILLLNFNRVGY